MLRAVGHGGWGPALVGCLAIASALGEAAVTRSRRLAAAACAGLVVLATLPALPTGDPAALRGVGAVHMASYQHPPKRVPPGVSLLVWPEIAVAERPAVVEGPASGLQLAPPVVAPGTAHLVGMVTRSPGGHQNAMLALAPDGRVLGMRAKSRLFPYTERPVFGWLKPGALGYAPGRAGPTLEVGGRKVACLVCVEAVDRPLAARARAEGAAFIAVPTLETGLSGSDVGHEQVLAVAVLRAAETGLPVVRASLHGVAAFVGPDGRVLARSAPGTDGVLTLEDDHRMP